MGIPEASLSCIKYLMFFFNLLFWLSGLALVILGAVIRDQYGNYITFADSRYANAAVFLIVIGVIVFIVGFLGCCGAIKENYCMITTFAVLLTIVFVLEIVAGSLGYAYRKKVTAIVEKSLRRGLDNYRTEEGAKKFFDWLQSKLKCCGYNSAKDWENKTISIAVAGSSRVNATTASPVTAKSINATTATHVTVGNGTVAPTAHTAHTHKVPASCKSDGKVYKYGCKDKFEEFLHKNLLLVGGIGIGLAFLQILGILFACCLMKQIRSEYESI